MSPREEVMEERRKKERRRKQALLRRIVNKMSIDELTTFYVLEANVNNLLAGGGNPNHNDPNDTDSNLLYLHKPEGLEYIAKFQHDSSFFSRCKEQPSYEIDLSKREVLGLVFDGNESIKDISIEDRYITLVKKSKNQYMQQVSLVPHQCVINWIIGEVLSMEDIEKLFKNGFRHGSKLFTEQSTWKQEMAGVTDTWSDFTSYALLRGHPESSRFILSAKSDTDDMPATAYLSYEYQRQLCFYSNNMPIRSELERGIIP